ncbi:GDP-mannose transporter into the lumen of the Golgi [Thecaphora frezii]
MSSASRSFFAPEETRLDLPQGSSSQTPDITRPASPSESDRAPFLIGNGDANGGRAREDARLGAKALKPDSDGVGLASLAPIFSYCGASIMMTVVNKFTVSGAGFNMNLLVLLIQSTVGVVCVIAAERLGWIQLRGLNAKDAKTWAPISTLLVFVIYTGSKAIQYLNIPVYTIFKNLTIILIAYGEVLWFGGRVTKLVLSSFILMVVSSIVAASSDVSRAAAASNASAPHIPDGHSAAAQVGSAADNDVFEHFSSMSLLSSGYLWMFCNCICSAAYVLAMRKRIKITGFRDWDSMYYNNLLSIPVLLLMSFLVEDWSSANLTKNFPDEKRTNLVTAIVFSGACAVFISYTTAWCIRATSSTTYSMVGALNKLPLAVSGMVFFKDPPVTLGSTSAIGLGFLAGLVYAYAKNKQAEAAKLATTTPATGVESESRSHANSAKGVIPMHNLNSKD